MAEAVWTLTQTSEPDAQSPEATTSKPPPTEAGSSPPLTGEADAQKVPSKESVAKAPTGSNEPQALELEEALAAEDEAIELEALRIERLERRRALDDARLMAQVERRGSVPMGAASTGQFSGGDPNPHRDSRGQSFTWVPQAGPTGSVSTMPALDIPAANLGPAPSPEAEASASTRRAERVAHTALERVRDLAKSKQLSEGKLQLTIRLDETTHVKLAITPRGDGTHELAFWVADPRLREELQRSLPEIRVAATELPIHVTEVIVGDLTEPGLDRTLHQREQKDKV